MIVFFSFEVTKITMMPHSDTFYPKPSHLIDHLNLSEGQAIQPVYFNHVTLTMSFC